MSLPEHTRRVLGNLSEPTSVALLTRRLRVDADSPFDAKEAFSTVQEEVAAIVAEGVEQGTIVAIGRHSDPSSMTQALAAAENAIEVPTVKLESLCDRLDSGRDVRLDTGELYILSEEGLRELTA